MYKNRLDSTHLYASNSIKTDEDSILDLDNSNRNKKKNANNPRNMVNEYIDN